MNIRILIYAGYYLKSLGDVSNLQPTSMLIANASRLTEIECHSPNLINTDLSECTKLQKIDLSDCTALGTGIGAQPILNIQNCNYLRTCNCLNTQLTAIYTKQAGGNLEEIYYPETTQVVQLTNQTHLKVVGIPRDDKAPKSLAQVEIENCNNVEYLQYPYTEGEEIVFDSLKYVQSLSITNSLDKLKHMSFAGFNKLMTVNLSSLLNLEKLDFKDMLKKEDVSTLKNITVSNCPLITDVSFNVSSNDYKFAFINGGKIDLGNMNSLTKVESNTDIIGLNTLIIPTSLKELKFTNEYSTGINDIKSILSASANHETDGFVGIDLLDINLTYLDMATLVNVVNGINFHISPITQHPNLNTYRDGINTPFFRPEGTMDLTNYLGTYPCLYKGIDFNKLKVTVSSKQEPYVTDVSGLFEGAIFTEELIDIVDEMNKYPNSTNWSNLLKNSISDVDSTVLDIPIDKPMNLSGMYEGTDITQDIDLPPNVINVDNMFKDCKNITSYKENWYKTYDNEISHVDAYKGTGNDRVVPIDWGGKGYKAGYVSEIVIDVPTNNYNFTLTNEPDYHIIGDGVINWGDGTEEILDGNYTHTYTRKGQYTIQGNFVLGNTITPSDSVRECLVEVHMMASAVGDLSRAFQYCNNLKSVDFDTSHVTNMQAMFYSCSSLTSLDLSNFNTENVNNMGEMFYNCSSLTSLDVTNFDTTKVTSMGAMFQNCSSLTSLDISNFNTEKVTTMYAMFYGCSNLISLDVTNFNTDEVTTMQQMFQNCSGLTSLDVSNFNTEKVTTMQGMFQNCTSLNLLRIYESSKSTVESIIKLLPTRTNSLAVGNAEISITPPTGWRYKYVIPMTIAQYTCNKSGVLPTFNSGFTEYTVEEVNKNGLYEILIKRTSDIRPTSVSFNDKINLVSVYEIDTSEINNMGAMFQNCSKLTTLDVSNFNTTKVTTMYNMFNGCSSLTSLDLSNFNTEKVTTMGSMFQNCSGLTSLDVSNFNTEKVTNIINIFTDCNSLQELNLSTWSSIIDTQNAINTLPVGNDVKNIIYISLSVVPPTGWTIISPLMETIFDIINE